ncbi:MAG: hypothetical protein IIB60_00845 [Planctomycetes bacterium]|nr:hypothetical protein [Planctomycetota bacterium]MCH8967020.1 hypothetical protein [Planctomycetota bacterium]
MLCVTSRLTDYALAGWQVYFGTSPRVDLTLSLQNLAYHGLCQDRVVLTVLVFKHDAARKILRT